MEPDTSSTSEAVAIKTEIDVDLPTDVDTDPFAAVATDPSVEVELGLSAEVDTVPSALDQELKQEYMYHSIHQLLGPNMSVQRNFGHEGNPNLLDFCQPSCQDTSKLSGQFFCGGCGCMFDTACNLHAHILNHNLGGSYHYNHNSRTAFPKFDSVCSQSQTDLDLAKIVINKSIKRNTSEGGNIPECIEQKGIRKRVRRNKNSKPRVVKAKKQKKSTTTDKEVLKRKYESEVSSCQNEIIQTRSKEKESENCAHPVADFAEEKILSHENDDSDFAEENSLSYENNEPHIAEESSASHKNETLDFAKENSVSHKSDISDCAEEDSVSHENETSDLAKENIVSHKNDKSDIAASEKNDGSEYYSSAKSQGNGSISEEEQGCSKEKGLKRNTKGRFIKRSKADETKPVSRDKIHGKNTDRDQSKMLRLRGEHFKRDEICVLRVNQNPQKEISSIAKMTHIGHPYDPKLEYKIKHFKCVQCRLVFDSKEFLLVHRQKHEGKLVCDCCNETFQTLEELKSHVLEGKDNFKTSAEIYLCSICNMAITELKGLQAHMCVSAEDLEKQRQTVRIYSGPKTRKQDAYKHIPASKVTSEEKGMNRVQCETCQLWFENDVFLTRHALLHKFTFKCTRVVCNLHFISRVERTRHNSKPCLKEGVPSTCHICNKVFQHQSSFYKHLRIHTDSKDRLCEFCGKTFLSTTIDNLKAHIAKACPMIDREKKYSCEMCGFKFINDWYRRDHIERVHNDVRPFVCEVCAARFRSIKVLRNHVQMIHKDNPRLKCEICGEKFKYEKALIRHKNRHENPVGKEKCTYCGKVFHERWNLKAHMRQHTGEKPYKCDLCGQGFTHNVSKKTHMKKCG